MKRPPVNKKTIGAAAGILVIFIALLFASPILGGGWFGQTSTGPATEGGGHGDLDLLELNGSP